MEEDTISEERRVLDKRFSVARMMNIDDNKPIRRTL